MRTTKTFTATIYVGLREGYHENAVVHTLNELREYVIEYVNEVGLCVTITPTEFIYVDGQEKGVIIGLINYPRFPSTPMQIREKALRLAYLLRKRMGQQRVSVVMPDETLMLDGSPGEEMWA